MEARHLSAGPLFLRKGPSVPTPSEYARLPVGILPGPHRRDTGGAGRNLAQRWLLQASAEGLGDLSMQTISFIPALAPRILPLLVEDRAQSSVAFRRLGLRS